jgi:CRP-like cAMP-binding protein
MDKLKAYICSLIEASDSELEGFVKQCFIKQFKRKDWVQLANTTPRNTYFINKGLARFVITDSEGKEHNTHFSLEEQFSGDYASFLLEIPSLYAIQALEDVEIVVIPRKAVMWCYDHMKSGDRLGRLIAESFFVYQDGRIRNRYIRKPKARYDAITQLFPDIHNRVPQHMIASFLGITPVHLSRLKKQAYEKK